jgi:hypothetical protein
MIETHEKLRSLRIIGIIATLRSVVPCNDPIGAFTRILEGLSNERGHEKE